MTDCMTEVNRPLVADTHEHIFIIVEVSSDISSFSWYGEGLESAIHRVESVTAEGHRQLEIAWDTTGVKEVGVACTSPSGQAILFADASVKVVTPRPRPKDSDPPPVMPFGAKERVPELTYILTKGSGMNVNQDPLRFLPAADNFHTKWGLKPRIVDSFQDIVRDLGSPGTSGKKTCVRIVAHADSLALFGTFFRRWPRGGRPRADEQGHAAELCKGRCGGN